MATERWDQIEELFEQALDLAPDERLDFLRTRCGQNLELLKELELLLANDLRAGNDFLEVQSSVGRLVSAGDVTDRLIGQSVGSYRIKHVIARGGMGAVYLAEQASPRREVALKVMHRGTWTASAEKRFDVESRILAYLRHPNIAQVYEAGTAEVSIPLKRESLLVPPDSGIQVSSGAGEGSGPRPGVVQNIRVRYFAMEYIPEARTLIRYAREHALSISDRLNLFLPVCGAVHHGHQKGVIHRDLKPANILVDADGNVKVIDFGIARSTDSDIAVTTMHTEAGQILGTLAYMSPEQCAADPSQIDTTTDVYSLGLILYELLTGRMPYDVSNMTIHSAARVICEKEPTRPGAFDRRLRGDAETIIVKAIEKDPAKRYSTVAEFAADIRSLLSHEPILARTPTPYSRMLRWAARHPKKVAGLSSLAIASLIVGSALMSLWIVNSRPDRLELRRRGLDWDELYDRAVRQGDQAMLFSLGGNMLRQWQSPNDGICFAKLANRPAKWGGGKVVVLGFAEIADSPHRGELCVFDANRPYDEPIWHRAVEQESINAMPHDAWPRPRFEPGRKYSSDRFGVKHAWMFDVFPGDDHLGEEIVAYHQLDRGSQGVLRIYNLNGDVLFQAWQDGGIEEAYWLAKAGLLVFSGIKGDMDDQEYGLHLASNHPSVIFAIRPTPGDISNKWIHPHQPGEKPRFAGDAWRGEWYEPAWYKMPCPVIFASAKSFKRFFADRHSVPYPYDPDQYLELRMVSDSLRLSNGDHFGFTAILNQHGDIEQRLTLADGVRSAITENSGFPDPATFDLVNWKTPAFPCAAATTQPATSQGN